jgi:hypothetical protein
MLEYHERNKREGPAQTPGANAADLGTEETEKYFSIADKYGIDDMDIGESGESEQTVEQEYQAYITAPLSSKTVNIRVVQSSHLLATYHVTYFTTYLIRRTRRRVISDLNSDNELR